MRSDSHPLATLLDRVLFGLLGAAVLFGPLATGAVRPQDFLVLQGFVVLTAGVLTVRLWAGASSRFWWPPAAWAAAAFFAYALLRWHQADVEFIARQETLRVATYLVVFLAGLQVFSRAEWAERLAWCLVFLAMAISFYALFQFATGSDKVWSLTRPAQYAHRGSGTFICPNHLAGFLGLVLPLALAGAIVSRVPPVLRILLGYASLAIVAGIGATISRGGYLATAGALLLFTIILLRHRSFRITALILALGLGTLVAVGLRHDNRIVQRFDRMLAADKPETAILRLTLWEPAWNMWRNHPWLGVGPAHFETRFPAYRHPDVQARPGWVHNDYLNVLADWGLIGATLVAGTLAAVGAGMIRTLRYIRREEGHGSSRSTRKALLIGSTVGLFDIALHSFVDFNLQLPGNAIAAVTLLAILSAQLRHATDRHWAGRRLPSRLAFSALLLITSGWLVFQGVRRGREVHWLNQASASPPLSPARVECLKRAAALEPLNPETPHNIGETLRQRSWLGESDYAALATEAIPWFETAARLNPFDPYPPLRLGMCLHWLGRHDETGPYFDRAAKLDPNNYFILALLGWHYTQLGDYEAALPPLRRSLELYHAWHNPIARNYEQIVLRKLEESRSRQPAPPQ